jgi:hypothetical protein
VQAAIKFERGKKMIDVTKFNLTELQELQVQIQTELASRKSSDADTARQRNETERQARAILTEAKVGSLKGWEKPGDRRLYVGPVDDRGKAWGGSAKHPVRFYLLVDGTAYESAGWQCTQKEAYATGYLGDVIQAVTAALALLGETPETAARNLFHFHV